MRAPILVTISVAVMLAIAGGAWLVTTNLFEQPTDRRWCLDSDRGRLDQDEVTTQELKACFAKEGEQFVRVHYAEAKDVAKAFLTLLTAVLVASITFSEKIVGVGSARGSAKLLMVLCWLLLLLALVLCGTGLATMTVAMSWATNDPQFNFWLLETRAMRLFAYAGICFVAGLSAMLVTGVVSLFDPKRTEV